MLISTNVFVHAAENKNYSNFPKKKERKKNSVKKIGSPERDRDGKCDSHPISKALIQRHPEG